MSDSKKSKVVEYVTSSSHHFHDTDGCIFCNQLNLRSPSRDPVEVAFEERTAIIRTPQSMQDFVRLDDELSRLDSTLGYCSIASTSSLITILPSIPASNDPTSLCVQPDDISQSPTLQQSRLLTLVQSLHYAPIAIAATTPAPVPSPMPLYSNIPETLWWETVSASASTIALASGIPHCGFVGVAGQKVRKAGVKGKGKGKDMEMNVLGDKMQENVDTLRVIRRLHRKLADGTRSTAIEVSLSIIHRSTGSDSTNHMIG